MGRVVIQDQYGKELRASDYEALGKYVVSISIEDNRISLECVRRSADGGYEEAGPETITRRELETEEKISLETRNSGDKKREYYFALAEGHGSGKLRQLRRSRYSSRASRRLALEAGTTDERYYAYSFDGSFLGAHAKANEAILEAYDAMGCVVDSRQDYIWKRGGRKTRTELSGMENPQQSAGSRVFRRPWRFFWARRKSTATWRLIWPRAIRPMRFSRNSRRAACWICRAAL